VIGVVLVLLPFLRLLTFLRPLMYLTLIPTVTAATSALSAGSPATAPLARTLPVFLTSLLHQIPVLLVFLLAASRKMQHEGTAPLSKLGALLAFTLVALLSLADASVPPEVLERGLFGEADSVSALPILCYTLLLVGMLLSAAVTPGANAFARGIRQARRLGRARPSRWSDRAPNWVAVGGLVAITLLAGAAGTRVIPAPVSLVRSGLWATATTAAAVAFFGLAYQSFGLWFRKHSAVYLTLLLFLVWGVPLLLGAILAASNSSPSAEPPLILAVSPLAGIAAAFAHGPWRDALPAAKTAFIASALLAACFAGLCWAAVRRAAKTAQARS